MTDPIDHLHEECIAMQLAIRSRYRQLQLTARRWQPRPCPDAWEGRC